MLPEIKFRWLGFIMYFPSLYLLLSDVSWSYSTWDIYVVLVVGSRLHSKSSCYVLDLRTTSRCVRIGRCASRKECRHKCPWRCVVQKVIEYRAEQLVRNDDDSHHVSVSFILYSSTDLTSDCVQPRISAIREHGKNKINDNCCQTKRIFSLFWKKRQKWS